MDNNYFESLANSLQESTATTSTPSGDATAYLTVKVDIDCKLFCDGDFIDLFEASKVKKITIPIGQHLMTIESEKCEGLSEDQVIDANESGKNYLLLVNGMKQKEDSIIQRIEEEKRKAEENRRRIAVEEEAKRKAEEEEAKRKEEDKMRETLIRLFGARDDYGFSWRLNGYGDRKNIAKQNINYLFKGDSITIIIEDPNDENNEITKNLNLSDINSGLQKAAYGLFRAKDEDERAKIKQSFLKLMDVNYDFEDGDEAQYLIQVILFNELVFTHRDEDFLEQLGAIWD